MLLSIPSEVLTHVILNWMKVAVDEALRDEQAGFRKNHSFIDQIATLRIIVEQSSGHPTCTCYSWILRKPLILWIGRLCGRFFIIMVYLIKSSTCLRFSIRALIAKCFMEKLWLTNQGQDCCETGMPFFAIAVPCGIWLGVKERIRG